MEVCTNRCKSDTDICLLVFAKNLDRKIKFKLLHRKVERLYYFPDNTNYEYDIMQKG